MLTDATVPARVTIALLVACAGTLPTAGIALNRGCLAAPCITTVDDDATGFGTFQSHNQKVVSTPDGIS